MRLNTFISFLFLVISFNNTAQSLQIDSVAHLSYPAGVRMNDVWGYVDTAGNEYALVGKSNGLSVVDISDTNNLLEVFTEQSVYSIWRDIKTWGHYAYVTNESSGGLAIYDLSTLPDSVKSVRYFNGVNYSFEEAHNIFIDENGIAYIFGSKYPGGSFQTIILDVATNPGQPIELGYFDSLYLHDGYVRGDTLYGSAVYDGILVIVDVSNKANPQIIGSTPTPNNFTHNAWLSDNGKTIFTTDEVSGAYLAAYNLQNINAISQLDRIRSRNTSVVIPHNTHVLNDFLITSYYTLGVSIVDANRPSNLVEIGYFDTSPNYTGGTFNGNWGAYPYFPSGLCALTDIEEGLFLVRPHYKRASYLEGKVEDCNGFAISQADIEIVGSNLSATNSNLLGNYKTGSHLDGYQKVRVSKAGYQTLILDSVLLQSGQVYNLTAQLQDTTTFFTADIIDSLTAKISGVQLRIENQDTSFNSISNTQGRSFFNDLSFGNYTVYAGKWGYKDECFPNQQYNCQNNSGLYLLKNGYSDQFNLDFNWQVSGSASSGAWVREKPIGTIHVLSVANPGVDAQNDCGEFAYVTGNNSGPAFQSDLDGTSILTSPQIALNNYVNPYVNFYTWFYNGGSGANDNMHIEFQDAQGTWLRVDTIDATNQNNGWQLRSYRVADFLSISNFQALRVIAQDNAPDHIVEAGIDNFYISEGQPVGIQSNYFSNDIRLSPNPTKDWFIINSSEEIAGAELSIYDMQLRLIQRKIVQQNSERFTLEGQEAGVYFISLSLPNGKTYQDKLIKY